MQACDNICRCEQAVASAAVGNNHDVLSLCNCMQSVLHMYTQASLSTCLGHIIIHICHHVFSPTFDGRFACAYMNRLCQGILPTLYYSYHAMLVLLSSHYFLLMCWILKICICLSSVIVGSDYTTHSGKENIAAVFHEGSSTALMEILIHRDLLDEGEEYFTAELQSESK